MKILVADDSAMMVKIASGILQKAGHEVLSASDGQEALNTAQSAKPEAVFLDAEMPEMDGWEAAAEIRKALGAAVKIFLCTGHDLSDKQGELDKAGVNGYVTKPYQPEALLSKLG